SGRGVLVLLGLTLLAMIPLKRAMAGVVIPGRYWPLAGFAFGLLVGGTTGAGVILIAMLGGLGLAGAALVATDAAVSVVTGAVKSLTFGTLGALTPELLVFAIVIGVATLPGGYAARALMRRIPVHVHAALMDAIIAIGGLTFLWRGFRG
ncbi:MAG: sulfite exporter TauE/SafE family protein, partial [Beijerinckiaceae bacterium]